MPIRLALFLWLVSCLPLGLAQGGLWSSIQGRGARLPPPVDLAWKAPADTSGVEHYEVERRREPTAPAQRICRVPKTVLACVDTQPLMGTTYYLVYSVGPGGRSEIAQTSVTTATIEEEELRAPRKLSLGCVSSKAVVLTWEHPVAPPGAIPIESYEIWRRTSTGAEEQKVGTVPPTQTAFLDQGMAPGTYVYDAYSYNSSEPYPWSRPSNRLTVTVPTPPAKAPPTTRRRK